MSGHFEDGSNQLWSHCERALFQARRSLSTYQRGLLRAGTLAAYAAGEPPRHHRRRPHSRRPPPGPQRDQRQPPTCALGWPKVRCECWWTWCPGLQVSPPDLGLEPDHRALRSRVLSDSRTDGEQQSAASGSPGKSHSKSQRGPPSGDISRHRAIVCAVQVLSEPSRATPADARDVTGGQGVAGSNPAVPTQVRRLIRSSGPTLCPIWDQDRTYGVHPGAS